MPGPAPKRASQRQRTNRTSTAATLEADPAVKIDLPIRYSSWKCVDCYLRPGRHTEEYFDKEEIAPHDFIPAEVEWHPLTVRWWSVIWDSPMVQEWVNADVPDLVAIAFMWDNFYRLGEASIHAEIRMASREFGLSPLSRRSLQWEIHRAESVRKPPAAPPSRRGRANLSILEGRTA